MRHLPFAAPIKLVVLAALSFTASIVVFAELADLAPARTYTDAAIWWTLCSMVVGACGGVMLSFTTAKHPPLQFMLAGAGIFGSAYHLVQLIHLLLHFGRLPYYPIAVLMWALLGGIGCGILGGIGGGRRGAVWFCLIGGISFGLGQALDLLIRNGYLAMDTPPLTALELTLVRLSALACLGLITGTGFGLACVSIRRRA